MVVLMNIYLKGRGQEDRPQISECCVVVDIKVDIGQKGIEGV
jgi:hypothetical protein